MYSNNIIEDIKNINNIVIAGHTSPDGDAIGASFAFAQAIKKLGKTPIILLEEPAEKFSYLVGGEYIYAGDYDELSPEIFFALDCGSKDRLGMAEAVFERASLTYNIDHHISNDSYADNNIVDAGASSASEIVYELIKSMKEIEIDIGIAKAIYTGIIFDTAGFKHNSTRHNTHKVAGELIEMGVNNSFIHEKVLYEHSMVQVRIFNKALDNLIVDGVLAYTTLSTDEMKNCGAIGSDLEGIVEYILNIKGVEVSALLSERGHANVKISLRSKGLDVNEIADKFGGGGHKQAAGAGYDGTLNDALTDVVAEIKRKM